MARNSFILLLSRTEVSRLILGNMLRDVGSLKNSWERPRHEIIASAAAAAVFRSNWGPWHAVCIMFRTLWQSLTHFFGDKRNFHDRNETLHYAVKYRHRCCKYRWKGWKMVHRRLRLKSTPFKWELESMELPSILFSFSRRKYSIHGSECAKFEISEYVRVWREKMSRLKEGAQRLSSVDTPYSVSLPTPRTVTMSSDLWGAPSYVLRVSCVRSRTFRLVQGRNIQYIYSLTWARSATLKQAVVM
jgi:hypothetical protein